MHSLFIITLKIKSLEVILPLTQCFLHATEDKRVTTVREFYKKTNSFHNQVDTTKLRQPDDLKADDMGIWVHKGILFPIDIVHIPKD